MTTHKVLERRMALKHALFVSERGLPISALAAQFRRDRTTIYRDLRALGAERIGICWQLRPSPADVAFAQVVLRAFERANNG